MCEDPQGSTSSRALASWYTSARSGGRPRRATVRTPTRGPTEGTQSVPSVVRDPIVKVYSYKSWRGRGAPHQDAAPTGLRLYSDGARTTPLTAARFPSWRRVRTRFDRLPGRQESGAVLSHHAWSCQSDDLRGRTAFIIPKVSSLTHRERHERKECRRERDPRNRGQSPGGLRRMDQPQAPRESLVEAQWGQADDHEPGR